MVKAAFGYVAPLCCPVHTVSFHAYRRVAWAATGNTSTSCSCTCGGKHLQQCSRRVVRGLNEEKSVCLRS